MLKRVGINPKNIDVEKLHSDYNALYSKKQALQKTYKSTEKEIVDLNYKLNNLKQFLYQTKENSTPQIPRHPSNTLYNLI